MSIIVAVDGGASRCRLAAFNSQGDELCRVTVDEHASLSSGVQTAWQHIGQGVAQIGKLLKLPDGWMPDQFSFGLAGTLKDDQRQEFLALIPKTIKRILVTDGHAQLFGASGGHPGICLALGTGSVIHWMETDGSTHMAGGWGFPAGDEGSGAWIGSRLVQTYLWHCDGCLQTGTLINELTIRIGTGVSDIQQWSTQSQSGVMAQLAPLAFQHAQQGDKLAQAIVQEAVDYAHKLIALAPSHLPVYVVGGIGEQLRPHLHDGLGSRLEAAKGDALIGLWQLCKEQEK